MTLIGTHIAALVAALVVAAGGLVGSAAGDDAGSSARTALVIDADAARDGRDLLDDRLSDVDAEVRVARTAAEARTNLRYFAEQGYEIVAAGPTSAEAAAATAIPAKRTAGLAGALAAAGR